MPDTKGQSGVEHFEQAARLIEETSNDGKFSSYSVTQGTGGDGSSHQQERGGPAKPKPKKGKK